jgi:hypothetical protein
LYEVTPLEGLRSRLPAGVDLRHFSGHAETGPAASLIPSEYLGIADPGAGTNGWVASYTALGSLFTFIPLGGPCGVRRLGAAFRRASRRPSHGRSRPAIQSGAEAPHSKIKTFTLTQYISPTMTWPARPRCGAPKPRLTMIGTGQCRRPAGASWRGR